MPATPEGEIAAAPKKVVTPKVVKPAEKAAAVAMDETPTPKVVKATPKPAAKAPKAAPKAAAKAKPKATSKGPVAPAVSPKADKTVKPRKPKLVRDSFTIPKTEYVVLEELKLRAIKLASPIKKTELIRAGIKALAAMSDTSFLAALKAVPAIKTGRPAKS